MTTTGPCPITEDLIHHLDKRWPKTLYETERDALLKLRLDHRNNNWTPVLDTRAFATVLISCGLVLLSLEQPRFSGAPEAKPIAALTWDDVVAGQAWKTIDCALDPAKIIITDHKLRGSPRSMDQVLVQAAEEHVALVVKVMKLTRVVELLVSGRLLWPPLHIGELFADVLSNRHVTPPQSLVRVATLFSITPETQDVWRKKTPASLLLRSG